MRDGVSQVEKLQEAGVQPFRTLSEEQEKAIRRWRTSGIANKEGLVITLFSLGVLLVGLLIALRSL